MRLIDADELKKAICKEFCGSNKSCVPDPCGNIELIDEMPTIDAVPVVRCENCQYWQPPTYQEQEDGSTVGHCTAALNGQQTDAYWFCADGTR